MFSWKDEVLAYLFLPETNRQGNRWKCSQRCYPAKKWIHIHIPTISTTNTRSALGTGFSFQRSAYDRFCSQSSTAVKLLQHMHGLCLLFFVSNPFSLSEKMSFDVIFVATACHWALWCVTYTISNTCRKKVKVLPPDRIAVIFDGWSGGDTN